MFDANRRAFLGAFALGAGSLAAIRSFANDGHAAGYDVGPAGNFMQTVPRKSGDPLKFTFELDNGPIKATSGGWARDFTSARFPIATDIAGAHLFMNPGGAREMHWHNAAEWALILGGQCQVTVVDPQGETEVANYGPGDLWFFPKGHAHSIQTLGKEPCHAFLAFDDGLYSDHGTFGVSDWMSRFDSKMLQQAYGLPAGFLAGIPKAETYINQGEVIGLDSAQARNVKVLNAARSHRYSLLKQKPRESSPGGVFYVAAATEYPVSSTMSSWFLQLKPGALHKPHWHSNASELHYVVKGHVRMTMFGADKRMAVSDVGPGECAYVPQGCGHSLQNIGAKQAEVAGVLNSGTYSESTLSDWLVNAPRHLLANNYGLPEARIAAVATSRSVIAGAATDCHPMANCSR